MHITKLYVCVKLERCVDTTMQHCVYPMIRDRRVFGERGAHAPNRIRAGTRDDRLFFFVFFSLTRRSLVATRTLENGISGIVYFRGDEPSRDENETLKRVFDVRVHVAPRSTQPNLTGRSNTRFDRRVCTYVVYTCLCIYVTRATCSYNFVQSTQTLIVCATVDRSRELEHCARIDRNYVFNLVSRLCP